MYVTNIQNNILNDWNEISYTVVHNCILSLSWLSGVEVDNSILLIPVNDQSCRCIHTKRLCFWSFLKNTQIKCQLGDYDYDSPKHFICNYKITV